MEEKAPRKDWVTMGKTEKIKKGETLMSKFHSTVSRRDFMKGLGLAGAGLGAASATTPVFHDLDELISSDSSPSTSAIYKAPWWVKELDNEKPTVEIDWSQVIRLDQGEVYDIHPLLGFFHILHSPDHPDAVADPTEMLEDYIKGKHPEWKGSQTRDHALSKGADAASFDHVHSDGIPWLGLRNTPTPEQLGVPKHQGTPEENLKMCRAFLRLVGAHDVGNVPFTSNTRKLVFSRGYARPSSSPHGYPVPTVKEIQFTDDEEPSDTENAWKIPNKMNNVLVYSLLNCTELCLGNTISLPGPTVGNDIIGTMLGYQRSYIADIAIMGFLRTLGYQALRACSYHFCASNPFGILAGIGEHSRMSNVIVSPIYGATIRVTDRCPTDLPLAPTKPIDAGIMKFCETCSICAEECPFDALGGEKPSWDHWKYPDEPRGNGNAPGYKGWRLNLHACNYCGICQAVCPFNAVDGSWVHGPIKATIGTTSIFNSFFANMERTFGYGFKNPETWWDMEQPTFGIKKEWLGGD